MYTRIPGYAAPGLSSSPDFLIPTPEFAPHIIPAATPHNPRCIAVSAHHARATPKYFGAWLFFLCRYDSIARRLKIVQKRLV